MKIRMLNGTGHTDLDLPVEEAIREIEKAMNEIPRSILVEATPGAEAFRVNKAEDLREYPEATVWLVPQLVGG